jgi:hypothetical protein
MEWSGHIARMPILAEGKDVSSSLCVQTGSEVHPASYPVGTAGPFLGVKCGLGVTLTTHPIYCRGKKMSRSYTYFHPSAFVVCSGTEKY